MEMACTIGVWLWRCGLFFGDRIVVDIAIRS
jgi:hypothetical protein